jgi:hypothetical protein
LLLEEEEEEDGVGLLWAKLEEEEELAESLNMFFSKIDESGLGMSPMSTSILREEERKEGESGKRERKAGMVAHKVLNGGRASCIHNRGSGGRGRFRGGGR